MTELTEANFDERIKEGLVLVDFFTPYCGPCRMLAPLLSQLKNVTIYKANVDEHPGLCMRYHFSSVPTLIFFKDGQEVARMVGLQSVAVIQGKIDELNGQAS